MLGGILYPTDQKVMLFSLILTQSSKMRKFFKTPWRKKKKRFVLENTFPYNFLLLIISPQLAQSNNPNSPWLQEQLLSKKRPILSNCSSGDKVWGNEIRESDPTKSDPWKTIPTACIHFCRTRTLKLKPYPIRQTLKRPRFPIRI